MNHLKNNVKLSQLPNANKRWQLCFTVILWILFMGSMLIYDSHLKFACRDAKEIFQLLLISIFIGLRLWHTSKHIPLGVRNSWIDWLVLVIGLIGIISFFTSPFHPIALRNFINLIVYLLFFLALRDYLETHSKPFSILIPFLFAAVFSSVYAIFQYVGIDPIFQPVRTFSENRWLVAGFIGQQTLFAGVIGPLVPFAFSCVNRYRNIPLKLTCFTSAVLIIIATLLTHTRAILMAYVIAIISAGIILSLSAKKSQIKHVVILAIILTFIFIVFFVSMPSLKTRITDGFDLRSPSVKARLHYWQCTLELIKEKPLFGWGIGSFQKVYPQAQIKIRTSGSTPIHLGKEFVTHPHNEYLLLLSEGGIILLGCFMLLAISIIGKGIRTFFLTPDNKDNISLLASLLGLIILMVDAFFSFPFHIGPSALLAIAFSSLLVNQTSQPGNNQIM